MLTVACVLSGGVYARRHVTRLEGLVRMKQPYRFVCVSDSPYPKWWAKISLFEPGRFAGRVLYLDLDVTPVGDLDDLANIEFEFAAIKDYQYPARINSSVMVWDAGKFDRIHESFTRNDTRRLHGDQDWIWEIARPMTFPKRWCPSYKKDVLPAGKVPDDARVIVYHGQPKPWDVDPD